MGPITVAEMLRSLEGRVPPALVDHVRDILRKQDGRTFCNESELVDLIERYGYSNHAGATIVDAESWQIIEEDSSS